MALRYRRLEFKPLLCLALAGVTWGKLVNLSVPQSPKWDDIPSFLVLVQEFDGLIL